MQFRRIGWRVLAPVLASAVLAGCGGGGGGGDEPPTAGGGTRQPPAAFSSDSFPSGPTMSSGAREYLPYHRNGRWVYQRTQGGLAAGTVEETSTPTTGGATVSQRVDGVTSAQTYRWTDRGWEFDAGAVLSLPEAAARTIGSMLAYPARFPALGASIVQVRRGSYGLDLDGDGTPEGFELRITQTPVAMETTNGPSGPLPALRLRTLVTLTLYPSWVERYADFTQNFESSEWLVEGVGIVRAVVTVYDSGGGNTPAEEQRLSSVTIDGADPLAAPGFARVQTVDLPHDAVVADPARGVYYASVPFSDPTRGNRIATIDARDGTVTLSSPVGSSPGPLALAADGASLYVGLRGSGELLRLSLPGMTELSRTRLPTSAFYGQQVAQAIAASPTEPSTVAVALARTSVIPAHGGVVLWRDGTLLPRQTADHTGSNVIVFGADGQEIFGLNNESTESGLRRLRVLDDGLEQTELVSSGISTFAIRSIDREADRLVFGGAVFGTDLRQRALFAEANGCRTAAPARIVCLNGGLFGGGDELLVIDSQGVARVGAVLLPPGNGAGRRLTAGLSGLIAVSDGLPHPADATAARLLLVSAEALP